jgi:hypothetical protein
MNDAGAEHLAGLRADLHCERCKYNLRGLEGSVVICPECGLSCNVEAVLSRKWDLPWYKAPGLKSLATPAAAGMAYGVVAAPLFIIMALTEDKTLTLLVMLLPLVAWVTATVSVVSISGAEAGWAAAGVTILVPVFALSVVTTIVGGMTTVGMLSSGDVESAWVPVSIAAVAAGLVVLCRRVAIAIARWCIRRHLDGKTVGVRKS